MFYRLSAPAARPPCDVSFSIPFAATAVAAGCRRALDAASSPRWLAQIRVIVCLVLLAFTVREDFAGIAALPASMRVDMGVIRWLYAVPGFAAFARDPAMLRAAQVVTALLLAAGAVGWRTRAVLPLAAVGTLLLGGIWRQYCHLYHTGLLPWYALAALCLTPCGDALSLDGRRRTARRLAPATAGRPASAYGWSVLLCWAAIAVPYTLCGLSKLRSGGADWWSADNLRAILYVDNLQPMSFHLGLGLRLADAPDWLLSAAALGVVVAESAFVAVLVSRRARLVLPAAMAGVHLGILLFQHVPFPDLIVTQLIFYNLLGRPGRDSAPARPPRGVEPRSSRLTRYAYPSAVVAMTLVFAVAWVRRTEFYPFTSMRMYCGANPSGTIVYTQVSALRADGRVTPAPLDEAVPALGRGEARYRDVLRWAFSPLGERSAACGAFLRFAGERFNDRPAAAPAERVPTHAGGHPEDIVAFEVTERMWDYKADPYDPARGRVTRSRTVAVVPEALANLPVPPSVADVRTP